MCSDEKAKIVEDVNATDEGRELMLERSSDKDGTRPTDRSTYPGYVLRTYWGLDGQKKRRAATVADPALTT